MNIEAVADLLMDKFAMVGCDAMQRFRKQPLTNWSGWLSVHEGGKHKTEAEARAALRAFIVKALQPGDAPKFGDADKP